MAAVRRLLPLVLLAALGVAAFAAVPARGAVTVHRGDTLGGIAARLGTTPAALAALNGIADPNRIVAGTVLRTASGGAPATASSGATGSYTVRSGDTLGAIAARAGTTVGALARANGIRNPNVLSIGTVLRVPGGATTGSATTGASAGSTTSYTVRSGDTLAAIAARTGTTTAALARMNSLANPGLIAIGAVLRVPGTAAASGPPLPWVDPGTVQSLIAQHAARYGVSLSLARAVAWQESGFRQDVRSKVGAMGVMQLMPGTAAWVGPALLGRRIDPASVSDNVEGGMAFLAYLLRRTGGNTSRALAGYNQGLDSVAKNGTFQETRQYVASILSMTGRV